MTASSPYVSEIRALVAQLKLQIEKSRALVVASHVSLSSYYRAAEIRRKMKLKDVKPQEKVEIP